jgi:Rrf2 family protein
MLKVSTRVRYGTRALVHIASTHPSQAVPVKEIARAQNLSVKYLEHIVSSLKAAGLIRSVRGMQGGYALAKPPRSIRLDEVIRALDGPPVIVECVDNPEACCRHTICPTRDVWVKVRKAVDDVLSGTTVEDLVESARAKGKSSPLSYAI